MGGPSSLDEVEPFLYNLFSDPELIRLPFIIRLFQKPIAKLITKIRASKTKDMYRQIGNGSPILFHTLNLAKKIDLYFSELGYDTKTSVAMRYSSPTAQQAIDELDIPGTIILFSQYPYYSEFTAGSSLSDFHRALSKKIWETPPNIIELTDWGNEPEYISYYQEQLKKCIPLIKNPENIHIVFSAHGLPKSYIKENDIYVKSINDSVIKIMEELDFPYHISYQSRNGPMPWLEPYTDELIDRLSKVATAIIVVPLGFVNDHVETLYEIDILFRNIAESKGVEFHRVNAPNDDDDYVRGVVNILRRKIEAII